MSLYECNIFAMSGKSRVSGKNILSILDASNIAKMYNKTLQSVMLDASKIDVYVIV